MPREQRVKRALFYSIAALMLTGGIGAALVLTSQWHPKPPTPDVTALANQVRDRDLLTPQEKEWARESGVGSYWFDGMYYVDWGLPSIYWNE